MSIKKGLTILTTAAVGLACFTVGFSAGRQTLDQSPAKNAELVLRSYEERQGPVVIQRDITATVHSGPLTLRLGKNPQNLTLDTTDCAPVVERPTGWGAFYQVGSGTPTVTLHNPNGKTTVALP